jgi:glucan phosphoethanolaminetransferase (alkaline phosphatase superfamily)
MELALNLGWVVLVTLMCWLWLRHPARCEGRGCWAQLVSLALVLVMMFVVITMYDDMAMAQNPTETSCFAREDLSGARAHGLPHPVANFTQPLIAEPSFQASYLGVVGNHPVSALRLPAMVSIQNRPPPPAA